MMTTEQKIATIENEMTCVRRKIKTNCSDCGNCDLVMDDADILGALAGAIASLRRTAEDDKAREEGRLVVLPCKVGDKVRATVQRPYNGHTATIYGTVSDIQTVVRVSYNAGRHIDFLASDFGKTVFLTRAEAEAALNGGGEGD